MLSLKNLQDSSIQWFFSANLL